MRSNDSIVGRRDNPDRRELFGERRSRIRAEGFLTDRGRTRRPGKQHDNQESGGGGRRDHPHPAIPCPVALEEATRRGDELPALATVREMFFQSGTGFGGEALAKICRDVFGGRVLGQRLTGMEVGH